MIEKVKSNDFFYFYYLYMNLEINPYLLYEMMEEETFSSIFDDLIKEEVLFLYKTE